MLIGLLRQLAKLPLSWIQAAGALIGWIVYFSSPAYAARLRENLLQSGLCRDEKDFRRVLNRNIGEAGRAGSELAAVWFRPVADSLRLVVRSSPVAAAEEAERRGRGVIYLSPHFGCFELAALWLAQRRPMTVLYRPPRKAYLQPLIDAGRGRDRVHLAPANLGGVRLLLKALRRGEAVGILPDQVPANGEGAWVDYFGRPAYTMTLIGKLVEATGATIVLFAGIRLPHAAGYAVHLEQFEGDCTGAAGLRTLNATMERMVAIDPAQYLWSYNRYKVPSGVAPPEANEARP